MPTGSISACHTTCKGKILLPIKGDNLPYILGLNTLRRFTQTVKINAQPSLPGATQLQLPASSVAATYHSKTCRIFTSIVHWIRLTNEPVQLIQKWFYSVILLSSYQLLRGCILHQLKFLSYFFELPPIEHITIVKSEWPVCMGTVGWSLWGHSSCTSWTW